VGKNGKKIRYGPGCKLACVNEKKQRRSMEVYGLQTVKTGWREWGIGGVLVDHGGADVRVGRARGSGTE
jgi:hypothetical protein